MSRLANFFCVFFSVLTSVAQADFPKVAPVDVVAKNWVSEYSVSQELLNEMTESYNQFFISKNLRPVPFANLTKSQLRLPSSETPAPSEVPVEIVFPQEKIWPLESMSIAGNYKFLEVANPDQKVIQTRRIGIKGRVLSATDDAKRALFYSKRLALGELAKAEAARIKGIELSVEISKSLEVKNFISPAPGRRGAFMMFYSEELDALVSMKNSKGLEGHGGEVSAVPAALHLEVQRHSHPAPFGIEQAKLNQFEGWGSKAWFSSQFADLTFEVENPGKEIPEAWYALQQAEFRMLKDGSLIMYESHQSRAQCDEDDSKKVLDLVASKQMEIEGTYECWVDIEDEAAYQLVKAKK